MESASIPDVKFVGGTKGGFIFTDFLFASDGMYSIAKILEMMALAGQRFGTLDKQVPRLSMTKRTIHCPWDKKGKVMRHMMRDTEGKKRIMVDGIKIIMDTKTSTSVLMWPDRAKPSFHIHSESLDQSTAGLLAEQYEEKIVSWRDATE
jgi:mannose-1-phosphate guanylyltransferase/phosphomannomutase